MILEIHPAHRLHHGVGIRLPAGLGEPVKNAGYPAATAADGEAVPDKKALGFGPGPLPPTAE
jgi:hypothetical protein